MDLRTQLAKEIWGIHPSALARIMAAETDKQVEEVTKAQPIEALAKPRANKGGVVALMPLMGVVTKRGDGVDVSAFEQKFIETANDPEVKAIVLHIDSPGGVVTGVPELAETIYNARTQKHIVAVADDMAASAAYWIASAADELVVTPTGDVGSVGVFTMHMDISQLLENAGVKTTIIKAGKYKIEGNPFEPLTDEARENIQESVDDIYNDFINTLARNRDVARGDVLKTFGEGRLMAPKKALAAKMVDRVDTLAGVLERLGVPVNKLSGPVPSQDSRGQRISADNKRRWLSLQ